MIVLILLLLLLFFVSYIQMPIKSRKQIISELSSPNLNVRGPPQVRGKGMTFSRCKCGKGLPSRLSLIYNTAGSV